MGKKIVNLPSGSVNDNELAFLGDPSSGELYQISYLQLKNYFQQGLITDNTFNALSASYSQDSGSFVSNINTLGVNQGKYLLTSSYLVDSGSFVGKINTNTQAITNVFSSESNYLPTSSYLVDSGSFNARINNVSSSLTSLTGSYVTTGSFNGYTGSVQTQITNVFNSQSNCTLTSSYNALSSSYSSDSGSFNSRIIALSGSLGSLTGSYITTGSFNAFSGSYVSDSSSFNNRINSLSGSGGNVNTGSLLLTSSFNTYTSSANLQIANVYASESNYTPTGSFNTFSGSYVHDSSSFLNLISSVSGSGGGVSVVVFNAYTASTNTQVTNTYASESNYTPTSSFIALSSSYSTDSGSFNSRINTHTLQIANTFASESNYLPTASYLNDSSSFNSRINAITGSGGGGVSGSFVTTGSFNTYTASVQNNSQTLNDSSSILWNYALGNIANVTIAGNRSLNIINAASQSFGILKVIQDSIGGRTMSLSGGSIPTGYFLSSGPNQFDVLGFYYDGNSFLWSVTNYGTNYPNLSMPSMSIASVATSSISSSWTTVNSASNYYLQRANDVGYSTFLTTIYTGSATSFNDTGLSGSTTYYYRVKAQAPLYNDSLYNNASASTTIIFDQNALNYVNAANITGSAQTAVNNFVVGLKSANLWASMSVYYPLYGTSYAQAKWNLVNTGSYTLTETTSGSITYSTAGVTQVSGGALSTNYSASLQSASNNCFFVNVKTNVAGTFIDAGCSANDSTYIVSLANDGTHAWYGNDCGAVTTAIVPGGTSIGRYYNSRTSTGSATLYKGTSSISSTTNALTAGAPNTSSFNNYYILAGNNGSNGFAYLPSSRQVSGFALMQGMSVAQIATLDGLIATFETAIGH